MRDQKKKKNTQPQNTQQQNSDRKLLAPFAGAFLIAAAFFALAAIVGFGSEGARSEWGWGFAVLAFLAFGLWFFGRRKIAHVPSDEYSRQRAMLGFNAVFSTILFLALLVGINYIATRRHTVLDLTSNRINSLSDQTIRALGQLKGPVKFTYVWAPSETMRQVSPSAQAVLTAYQGASDHVRVEYLNAFQDPLKLQSLKLSTFTGQPLLLISDAAASQNSDAARQEVPVMDEQNVTSALLKIITPKPRVLYFLDGHGEMSPVQSGPNARLNGARSALEAQNYTLRNLSLLGAQSKIPADAAALIVLAPQVDLGANEVAKLKKYLVGKGRLLLFFDPVATPLTRWKTVTSELNVQLLDGLILEFNEDKMYTKPELVIGELGDTARQPLLRGVNANVIFPVATPLLTSGGANSIVSAFPLFQTSSMSRSVAQGRTMRELSQGPFVVATAVERTSGQAMRAVVVGNAAFATDAAWNQFGNASFFLSSVNWVVGNDALVSIPPKPPVTNSLNANDVTRRFAILIALVALPL